MDLKELYKELTGREPADMDYAHIVREGITYDLSFFNTTGQKLCMQSHTGKIPGCIVFEDDAAPPSADCEVVRFSGSADIGGYVLRLMRRHKEMVEESPKDAE